jgi:hypothetical protein
MEHPYEEVLQMALQLPPEQRLALADSLMERIQRDSALEEPEPGHDQWVRAGIEEALADSSGDVSHDEAMKQFHEAILSARKLKATA